MAPPLDGSCLVYCDNTGAIARAGKLNPYDKAHSAVLPPYLRDRGVRRHQSYEDRWRGESSRHFH